MLLIALGIDATELLRKVSVGSIPFGFVAKLLSYGVAFLLSIILPISLYLGIYLGFGHLAAHSEITAYLACGGSNRGLLKVGLLPTLVVLLLMLLLTLLIIPSSIKAQIKLLSQAKETVLTSVIQPGEFQALFSKEVIVFAERMSKNKTTASDVFLVKMPKASKGQVWEVVSAKNAYLDFSANPNHANHVVLKDGYSYMGIPGELAMTLAQFDEYGLKIPTVPEVDLPPTHEGKSLVELISSGSQRDKVELMWRLSYPFMVFPVLLMAVTLSFAKPRQGRFANLFKAILIIIVYYNVLSLARNYLVQGVLAWWLGVWWVHAVFFLLGWMMYNYKTRHKIVNSF